MKRSAHITCTALALVFAGASFAQTPAPPKGHTTTEHGFTAVDVNKDNRVSMAEANSYAELKSAFAALDTDRDNHLSAAEFAKFKPQPTPMK